MKIEHVAIWTKDIEVMRDFYVKYFDAKSDSKYKNGNRNFESYFLHFEGGARLELMQMPEIQDNNNDPLKQHLGLIHIAFSVGSKERVIGLTRQLHHDGYVIIDEPRTTGDGYFESSAFDPEHNRIEITI